jgi:hypothetical protein
MEYISKAALYSLTSTEMNTTGDFWRPKCREFVSLLVKFLVTKEKWGNDDIAKADDKDKRRINKDDLLILTKVVATMI